ncbi:class I SAM-dependent methyltransferase [Candidatus Peregrinibacteria bacterium]|nr:class I SAM-dependent methyltransferase [Candidatus Peregrinibacteria bacterium]
MPALPYDWSAKEACDAYEKTWEISRREVHYGWLSPGENTLRLLEDVPERSKALDVGCGMGENIVALHRLKLDAYGLDLSSYMVRKARRTLREEGMESKSYGLRKRVRQCDARAFASEFRTKFDVVLAVYSLEFFKDIQEFRKAISEITKGMVGGGTFVLCISHPTTHPDYPRIKNETELVGTSSVPLLMYSIRDVVQTLCEEKLVVERVIEQQTRRPSRLTYEEAGQFPYHFREGKNPFSPLFDDLNDKNPHTLIYRTRKES